MMSLNHLDAHQPLLSAEMIRITSIMAQDPVPREWIALQWDSTTGMNETVLDFWRYDYPRVARMGVFRRILRDLNCQQALTAMPIIDSMVRQRLGLLLTAVSALSIMPSPVSGGTPIAKFGFDLHRADEVRQDDEILSQRETTPEEIYQLVDDLCDRFDITRLNSQTNQFLSGYGLRPVMLGIAFAERGHKVTLYHSLDDRPTEARYQVVHDFVKKFQNDDYSQAVNIIAESGAVPVSISGYASAQGDMETKLDFRFTASSLPHHNRFLDMRILTHQPMRDWLKSGIPLDYLGVQMNSQGRIRLKFYP
jgi:hypothetical protein